MTNTSQSARCNHGQGLVEFALVLTLLLIIAFGVLDLARVFHTMIVVSNAAREGARFGSEYPDCLTTQLAYCPSTARQAAVNEAASAGLQITAGQVTFPVSASTEVKVRVTYTFKTLFGNLFSAPSLTISKEAIMLIMVSQ